MFSKRTSYNGFVTDLGDLDPWQITARQTLVLDRLLATSPHLDPGKYQVQILNKDATISTYALTLRFPIVYHGSFDPSDINEANAPILSQLLKRANNLGMCKSGLQCVRMPGSRAIDVYDSRYTIVPREKFANTTYYDLIGSGIVGEGAFGVVHPIVGTIKPRYGDVENLYFSPSENKRVMKLLYDYMHDDDRNPKIEKEVSLMRVAGYFKVRAKLNIEDDDHRVHMISMKRFHWVGLGRLILRDKSNKADLTIDDRLRLSIRLLRELQNKLHNKKIIHRDIKPDNIRVNKDKTTKYWEVNFIDLGLSLGELDYDDARKVVGTPYYIAPEVAGGEPQSQKSDIYSLARSIGQLWRDNELKTTTPATANVSGYLIKRRDEKDINYRMFDGLNMDDDLKSKIETVIRSLSISDPSMRAEIDVAVNELEKIRLDMVIQKTVAGDVEHVRAAHAAAMLLATKLDKHARNERCVSSEWFKMDVLANIDVLPENPLAISMFTDTLGVKCLHACKTKSQLKARVDSIFTDYMHVQSYYIDAVAKLRLVYNNYYTKSRSASLREYLLICDKFRDDLLSNLTCDLDSLVDITKHIKSKMKHLNAAIDHYQVLALSNRPPDALSSSETPGNYSLRK